LYSYNPHPKFEKPFHQGYRVAKFYIYGKAAVDSLLPRIQKNLKRFGYLILVFSLWTVLSVWTPAHAGKIVYSIQIGAFKELRYAINEQTKLKGSGRNVFYRHENVGSKGKLYRVYVEKYEGEKEAEKEAKILKQQGLIENYIIKTIKVGKEVNPPLVIKKITLNQDEGGTETLLIHSNRFFWPSVRFALEEDIPRLVIQINNTTTFKKKFSDPAFRGDLIKKIRNPPQQNGNNVRIILDLVPDRKYKVTQVFDKKDNIFNLAVELKNGEQ
jgi:hypothetical protein